MEPNDDPQPQLADCQTDDHHHHPIWTFEARRTKCISYERNLKTSGTSGKKLVTMLPTITKQVVSQYHLHLLPFSSSSRHFETGGVLDLFRSSPRRKISREFKVDGFTQVEMRIEVIIVIPLVKYSRRLN